MPFIKKTCTEQEGEDMFLQNEELKRIYKKCGRGNILYADISLTAWFLNEEENAAFCLLELGFDPSSLDGKHIFMLKVKSQHIIFELEDYNTVIFLHDSPLLKNEIYKIKYLIASAINMAGRWGSGVTDILDAVPDPVFNFSPLSGG
ncbi:hypothetical protein V2E67_002795 [Citrobacter freundii]|nr:hypothetical protein [Citrobacter freundii]